VRVLVTGGSGFLGAHLCAHLASLDAEVDAPSRELLDLATGVGMDAALAGGRDVVFHLGAVTDPARAAADPERAHEVNVAGTERLLDALSTHAPKSLLVYVSTCHVYGVPAVLPIPESHRMHPRGVYAATKAAAERLVSASGLSAIVARPFNLTGPGQPLAHAPADWAQQARDGAAVIEVGDLRPRRDYLDVRDAARALALLAGRGQIGAAYNICSGRSVSMGWILDQVAPRRRHVHRAVRTRPLLVPELIGDPTALRRLGWRAEITLEQSLAELVAR